MFSPFPRPIWHRPLLALSLGLAVSVFAGCGCSSKKTEPQLPPGQEFLKADGPIQDTKLLYIGVPPKTGGFLDTSNVQLCATYNHRDHGNTITGESCLRLIADNWSLLPEQELPTQTPVRPSEEAKQIAIESWDRVEDLFGHRPQQGKNVIIPLGTLYQNGTVFWFQSVAGEWWFGDDALKAATIIWLREDRHQDARMNRFWEFRHQAYLAFQAEEAAAAVEAKKNTPQK